MLRKSLPTWFEQTIPQQEYEIIVVDNGSLDGTKQYIQSLLQEYPNCRYLYESSPGATAARHAGARMAKGEYLVFADNDGLFNSECLASILEVYQGNEKCAAVACKIDILWDENEPEWIAPYKYLLGQLDYGERIDYSTSYYLNGGLMSVRKDVFERLGGFNPDLVGQYLVGDGDLGLVKKLHAENALIGWTPNAHMWHMQQVSMHGSKRGIALHYFNNGIAESYGQYREQQFRMNGTMWKYLGVQLLVLLKKYVEYIIHPTQMKRYFALKQHQGSVRFFWHLLQPKLRLIRLRNRIYKCWMRLLWRIYGMQSPIVLMVHGFKASKTECKNAFEMTASSFERLMNYLIDNGWQAMTYEELKQMVNTRQWKRRCFYVTFDDVYDTVYTEAYPVLKRLNIPFHLFTTKSLVNQPTYISSSHIKTLSQDALCTIGCHGMEHKVFRNMSEAEVQRQCAAIQADSFAFPYGRLVEVSRSNRKQITKFGFSLAFSAIEGTIRSIWWTGKYFLPRVNVSETFVERFTQGKAIRYKDCEGR